MQWVLCPDRFSLSCLRIRVCGLSHHRLRQTEEGQTLSESRCSANGVFFFLSPTSLCAPVSQGTSVQSRERHREKACSWLLWAKWWGHSLLKAGGKQEVTVHTKFVQDSRLSCNTRCACEVTVSTEIKPFKNLGFLLVQLASFSSLVLLQRNNALTWIWRIPNRWIAVRTVHNGDEKSRYLLVGSTDHG